MSREYATNEQIERYMNLVIGNGLKDWELNAKKLKETSRHIMDIYIEELETEARDAECVANAYFNEF